MTKHKMPNKFRPDWKRPEPLLKPWHHWNGGKSEPSSPKN